MWLGGFQRPHREFWEQVITSVKMRYPDVIFLSEAYDYFFTSPPEQELLTKLGVDYSYNKVVLDKLEHMHLDDLQNYIKSQPESVLRKMCHFVENHDEPRAALSLQGKEQSLAGSVVALTIPGSRLTFQGQYEGLKNRLGIHLRRAMPEQADLGLHAKYQKLLEAIKDPVFHKGTWNYIDTPKDGSGWRLVAWRWEYQGEKRLVIVNFSDQQAWGSVPVPDARGRWGSDDLEIRDLLSGEKYTRKASEMRSSGLVVGLEQWNAHIFAY